MEPYNAQSAITHEFMVPNVSLAVPAIAASATGTATALVPGIRPGDVTWVTLAPSSAARPANLNADAMPTCSSAGSLTVLLSNVSALNATTATTLTVNVRVSSALP